MSVRRAPVVLPGETHFVDAIIGIRTWKARPHRGSVTLTSVYQEDVVWPLRAPLEARCHCKGVLSYRDDGSPMPGACVGGCGIYAWSDDLRAIEPVPVAHWVGSKHFVHGEVYLWGNVERWPYGYKAEFAMPAGFFLPEAPASRALATMAAEDWQVPLLTMPLLQETPAVPLSPSTQSATRVVGFMDPDPGYKVKAQAYTGDDSMPAPLTAREMARRNLRAYRQR